MENRSSTIAVVGTIPHCGRCGGVTEVFYNDVLHNPEKWVICRACKNIVIPRNEQVP